jgi:hypothetical protein
MFIYTNNMFIMIFNSRVSILNWNLFWPNRNDLTKIEVHEPLILDPWMIFNFSMLLISWNLVWIWVHIARFIRVLLVFFLFIIFFIHFVKEFCSFCVFQVFNLFFSFVLFLGFYFWSNQDFLFSLWSNKRFRVYPVGSSKKKKIKLFSLHMAKIPKFI